MTESQASPTQISTDQVPDDLIVSPGGPVGSVGVVVVSEPAGAPVSVEPTGTATAPQSIPPPTSPTDAAPGSAPSETVQEAMGVGVDGETVVWEAHYSYRNFIGRGILAAVLTVAWVGLTSYAYGMISGEDATAWRFLVWIGGVPLAIYLLALVRRILLARYGHFYRLTNRRLFVSSGLFRRRRDQIELLRVRDVSSQQSLSQRWLSLGNVVIESTEPHFPRLYLLGVDDPKTVMDLVWHYARSERDRRSVKVDSI